MNKDKEYNTLSQRLGFIPVAVLLREEKQDPLVNDPAEVLLIHVNDEDCFFRSAELDRVHCVRIDLRKREIIPAISKTVSMNPIVQLQKVKGPNKNGIIISKKKRVVINRESESDIRWTEKITKLYSRNPKWRELEKNEDKFEILGKIKDYMPKKLEDIQKMLLSAVIM